MKWTKQWVVLIALIFSASYIYTSFSTNKLSSQIKKNKLKTCSENDNCEIIEVYHNECFKKSYRSYMRTMRFYENEYDECIEKKKDSVLKRNPL
jgi:hypothetical protein